MRRYPLYPLILLSICVKSIARVEVILDFWCQASCWLVFADRAAVCKRIVTLGK